MQGNTDFVHKNDLNKVCFQHDMAYGKSKDLAKRTQSDKVLRDNSFKIASEAKHNGYQRGLASMVYKFLIKNLAEVVLLLRLQIHLLPNQIVNLQMNFIGRSLKNVRKKKFIHHLETIFGVLI